MELVWSCAFTQSMKIIELTVAPAPQKWPGRKLDRDWRIHPDWTKGHRGGEKSHFLSQHAKEETEVPSNLFLCSPFNKKHMVNKWKILSFSSKGGEKVIEGSDLSRLKSVAGKWGCKAWALIWKRGKGQQL